MLRIPKSLRPASILIALLTLGVIAGGSAPAATASNSTLDIIGHWRFNEPSGNVVVDSSGNGYDGTIFGATRVPGIVDGALQFGSGDRVEIPHDPAQNEPSTLTVEMIIKPTGATPRGFVPLVVKNRAGGRDGYLVWSAADGSDFRVNALYGDGSGGTRFVGSGEHPINDWYHVAVLFRPGELQLYVNGQLDGQNTNADTRIETSTQPIEIGGSTGFARPSFRGLIDEVRITREFLDPDDFLTINSAPTADAGPDQVVECESMNRAEVTLNGLLSSDPDGDTLQFTWTDASGSVLAQGDADAAGMPTVSLPVGTHVLTLTVMDAGGLMSTDTVTIVVQDTTPPRIDSAEASPDSLWPPNHRMVPVAVRVDASDACSTATCRIASVSSDEPVLGRGSGNTSPDWEITGDLTVNLRAERSGSGNGRIYTIVLECEDAAGNVAQSTTEVTVPRDRGGR